MDQTICEINQIKRAAGYIRVSTAEQATKGLSVETQMAEIESYARLNNMKVVGYYVDRGITARKSLEKRLDFMRMMEDVQSGKINHVIVLRLDRFFRNVYDYHKMMNEYLEPNKCDWSAVKESYTTTTTNGRLMINLRLSIAEQECDTDSDRIKDVFTNRIKNGYVVTGTQPWGFKIVNKRLVKDPEKRALMEDMLAYVEKSSSVTGTMKYMQEVHGIQFSYMSLSKLLKNPKLYGSFRGNDNYCEAYMTKERFLNMRRLLDMNIRVRKNNHSYVFSGLVFCDKCNCAMPGSHYGGHSYHRCSTSVIYKRCDNSNSINEVYIEKYLHDNVENLLRKYIFDSENSNEKEKPTRNNRKAIEKKLQKLNVLFVNDFITLEKYKEEYEFLQSQIIDEPEKPKKDFTVVKAFLESNYKETYDSLTKQERRALWRSIIKEIRVYKREIVSVIFL